MFQKIVLYDIDSKLPGRAWSPNVWKTRHVSFAYRELAHTSDLVLTQLKRYCLNFKGIPHRTEWVECPKIQAACISIGAEPTERRADGTWKYTVPAIHDPATGQSNADSIKIAEYLDSQYPDSPKLFPEGTKALQAAYIEAYRAAVPAIWQFGYSATVKILNPASAIPYERIRQKEEGLPRHLTEEERRAGWEKIEHDFGIIDGWLNKNGDNRPFLLGDKPAYVDFVFAGYLTWLKLAWGEESEEWKDMSRWHNGRWGKLIAELQEKYGTVY